MRYLVAPFGQTSYKLAEFWQALAKMTLGPTFKQKKSVK